MAQRINPVEPAAGNDVEAYALQVHAIQPLGHIVRRSVVSSVKRPRRSRMRNAHGILLDPVYNTLCLCVSFCANLLRSSALSAYDVAHSGIKFMTDVCVRC